MIKRTIHRLILSLIIFYIFTSFSFANTCEQWCKIKDWPAKVLKDYISNNRKVITNISRELGRIKSNSTFSTGVELKWWKINKKWNYNKNIWLQVYNSLFNWREVESGYQSFIAWIDWETPKAINRDFMMLNNENEALNSFLKSIISNWHYNKVLDINEVCKWLKSDNCIKDLGVEESEKSVDVREMITKLIKNNSTVSLIIRKELWVMWTSFITWSEKYEELIIVPKDFQKELKKSYNKSTYWSCARCNWWSLYKVNKFIEKITLNDKAWKKWIQEWKDAWDLLLEIWSDDESEKYKEEESKLLSKNLWDQWVSLKNWDSVLKWLDNFNNDWLSSKNNPIYNSFITFKEQFDTPSTRKMKKDLNIVISSISEESNTVIKSFSLWKLKVKKIVLEEDNLIKIKMNKIVKLNEAILSRQNINSWKLQARIIQMHINLLQTINKFDKIIPKSEKVCKDQDTWKGKCSF